MSLARCTRTASDVDEDVDKIISTFILTTGKPFIDDLTTEIEKAMNETSPVLSVFDMFNPQSSDMSYSTRKRSAITLCAHYGNLLTSTFNGTQTLLYLL